MRIFTYSYVAISKIKRYLREAYYCLKIGTTIKDSISLISATIIFHINNGIGKKLFGDEESPKQYEIEIGNRKHQIWMRTFCGDLFIFYEIFLDKCYKLPTINFSEIQNVVDLGANIGLTTLYLNTLFPQANYICVEPSPLNLPLLKKNLKPLGNRINIVEGAINDQKGFLKFRYSGSSWGGHLNSDDLSAINVRCYTMNEIMEYYEINHIDILKVDIEGVEKILFQNNCDWLKKVRFIIVELHDEYSLEDFKCDVSEYGFKVLAADSEYGNIMICALSSI